MKATEVGDLVHLHGIHVYNFCRYLTQNKEEADELYQDTFLKAVELCEKIDKEDNPKGFLLSVAAKLHKNRRRKSAWRGRIAAMESYEEELSYTDSCISVKQSPEDEFLEKEMQEAVAAAVRCLKEEYRLPMYLYYAAELSLKEISQILHVPEGTVKSRLHKARNEVRKSLEVIGYGR